MAWNLGLGRVARATSIVITAVAFAAAACAQEQPAASEVSPAPAASTANTAAPTSDQAAAPAASDANSTAALAKALANPVASLISVPFQSNFDGMIGPARNGQKYTLNIQPVIPIRLGDNWNLISRTIVPVVAQSDIFPGAGNQFGLSDTLQSFFLSPAKVGKLIWGVGPAVLIPTGTNTLLGTGKWSAGPTFVVLTQNKGWTVGALANQLWSFAGNNSRAPYSKLYFQPFLNYTTRTATTYGLSAEGTYDWLGHGLSMPLIATLSQVTKVGGQLISVGVAVKYYVATVPSGPHGVGGRLTLTFLYPRR